MSIFSKLFGRKQPNVEPTDGASDYVVTTADQPFRIDAPRIGFLNLMGEPGAALMDADCKVLAPLFKSSEVSSSSAPACNVLLIYCELEENGSISGSDASVRALIADAGALLAIIAAENPHENCFKALDQDSQWKANTIMAFDRKGELFAAFFARLFSSMFGGESMLMAWVRMAPQTSQHDHDDVPSTLLVPDAGHLTFRA